MLSRLPLIACALFVLASCGRQEPAKQQAEPAQRAEAPSPRLPIKGADRSHKGKPAADAAFNDPDGGEMSIADFHGVPVLVNLWASWCAPCVKELPTLDKLAAAHRADGQLGVIAVSQDSGPRASVAAFL